MNVVNFELELASIETRAARFFGVASTSLSTWPSVVGGPALYLGSFENIMPPPFCCWRSDAPPGDEMWIADVGIEKFNVARSADEVVESC